MTHEADADPRDQYLSMPVRVKPFALVTAIAAAAFILGLLFNPLAIPSVIAVVFAAIGLRRRVIWRAAGRALPRVGRGVVMLVAASVELLVSVVLILVSLANGGY